MGPEGTGSLELGDASGEIFHMEYPQPFLKYYYNTFPDETPRPKGKEASVPATVGMRTQDGSSSSDVKSSDLKADMHPDFPNLRLSMAPVFEFFAMFWSKLDLRVATLRRSFSA